MTICIGALCANAEGVAGGAVVAAADRMVTVGGLIEFEHEVPKFVRTSDSVAILFSGDALRGARLARALSPACEGVTSVEVVARTAADLYGEHRRKQVERQLFLPRGFSMQAYYDGKLAIPPQIAMNIDNQMISYDYSVDLLIAGVDETGAHLYSVSNPGGYHDYAMIGFAAIGNGTIHALQTMVGFHHAPSRALPKTVFAVFAAKRRAEIAPAVGRELDLFIVQEGTFKLLGREDIDRLDALYQEYERCAINSLGAKLAGFAVESLAIPRSMPMDRAMDR